MEKKIEWTEFLVFNKPSLTVAPEEGGVYELWSVGKSNQQPLYRKYIGRTSNLKRRLSEHLQGSGSNQGLKNFLKEYSVHFRTSIIQGEGDQAQIEMLLYLSHVDDGKSYIFNQEQPEGSSASQITSIREGD